MRDLGAIYILWYRDVLRYWRDKMRILSSLTFPLIFLLIFGGGLSGAMGPLAQGVNYAQFIFPGIIGMTVLMTSFMSGLSVVWDREFGFLKEVLVAPISRRAVVAGKVLGGATVAMVQGTLMLIFAPFIGVALSPGLLLALWPMMFLVACAISGLGILIASHMKSVEGFQAVTQMLVMPMIFLSGVFFPVGNLPSWMDLLVKINPVTYGVDAIRQLFMNLPGPIALGQAQDIAGGHIFRLSLWGHPMSLLEDVAVVAAFGVVVILLAARGLSAQE